VSDTQAGQDLGWPGWRFAAGAAAGAVAVACFVSFVIGPAVGLGWMEGGDTWLTTSSAQYVSFGGLGYVYSVNHAYLALPGFLVLYAPVVALGDRLGLATGYPFPLAHPTMWYVAGPFFFICGATAILGTDYLACTLGVARPRRRVLAVAGALLLVWPIAGLAGHPEDLLALALVCWSLGLHLRGRPYQSAAILALAVLTQTWAGLLIPVMVAASPAGRRIGFLLRSAVAPALTGLVLLSLDWRDASLDIIRQPMMDPAHLGLQSLAGQVLPWYHLAQRVTVGPGGQTLHGLVGSTSRLGAVVVALAAAAYAYRRPGPPALLLAASVTCLGRVLFEVEYWPYYVAPAAVLLVLHACAARPVRDRALVASVAGAFVLLVHSATLYWRWHFNEFTAMGILVGAGALALLPVLRRQPRPAQETASSRDLPSATMVPASISTTHGAALTP
jgi:hypothetical protein